MCQKLEYKIFNYFKFKIYFIKLNTGTGNVKVDFVSGFRSRSVLGRLRLRKFSGKRELNVGILLN